MEWQILLLFVGQADLQQCKLKNVYCLITQQTKTRSRSPAVPVAVLCSSSESETTSDSSDSSDSEDLENWMILGQGKRDEDQSISLHLEGASDSSTGERLFLCVSRKTY